MESNRTRSTGDQIPEILLEGLALDVSLLDALLKRHRCSHGRTIYFRRMSMTLNRLLRRESGSHVTPKKMITITDMVYRLKILKESISEYGEDQNSKSTSRKRRHNEEEEKWDLQSLKRTSMTATPLSQTKKIAEELKALIAFWTRNIPEILSRIQHASKSLFVEVSRGFFLPFCTVALSALARIRSLLMEIGLRGLTSMRGLSDEVLQILPKNDAQTLRTMLDDIDFQQYMNLFLENDDNEIERKRKILVKNISATHDVMCDKESILRTLGLMESTKPRSKAAGRLANGDPDIPINSNQMNDKQTHDSSVIETSSAEDYFTLASSISLEKRSDLGKGDDDETCNEMDDGVDVGNAGMPSKSKDSLDRNMALVNKFKKRKTKEKQSKKKEKTSRKIEDDSKLEAEESERTSKKRKHKKKESSKKKKKKKDKGDFFDQIFD